jgi:hypothetical protein
MAVWKLLHVGIMGRTFGTFAWFGLVWFGGTCRFLCKTLYSARGSLNEYCRSCHVVISACLLSVHCKLCIMSSCSVLYSTLTISKTDSSTTVTDIRTHCQSKTPVRFSFSKIRTLFSSRERESHHTECNQSTSLYQWRILTEVWTICVVAGGWCKTPLQPCAFIPIRRNPSRKVDIPNW